MSRIGATHRLTFPVIFCVHSHENIMPSSCPFSSIQISNDTRTLILQAWNKICSSCLENNDLITHKKSIVGTPHLYDERSLIGVVKNPGDYFVRQWLTRLYKL